MLLGLLVEDLYNTECTGHRELRSLFKICRVDRSFCMEDDKLFPELSGCLKFAHEHDLAIREYFAFLGLLFLVEFYTVDPA